MQCRALNDDFIVFKSPEWRGLRECCRTTRSPNGIGDEKHASSKRVGCVRHNQILEFAHTVYFGLGHSWKKFQKRCTQLEKVTSHVSPENAASACATVIAFALRWFGNKEPTAMVGISSLMQGLTRSVIRYCGSRTARASPRSFLVVRHLDYRSS